MRLTFLPELLGITLYSGGFIVLGGIGLWAGTHAYVENIELGASLPLQQLDEELYGLSEDDLELCFSGGHAGGGTDERLTFSIRNAIRAAFIAQHYGSRAVSVHQEDSTVKTVDAGVLEAERYLLYAIAETRKLGLDLPDKAVVEMENRLAGLRERLGGATGLLAAKVSYERIFDALLHQEHVANSSTATDDWNRREAARVARKAGEVSLRMALEQLNGEAAVQEQAVAESWLLRSAKLALRVPEHAIVVKPGSETSSSSSKGWLSRFTPASFSSSSSNIQVGRRPIDSILTTLEGQPFMLPVDARTLFSTLTSLSALYARISMPTATQLLTAALSLTPPNPKMAGDVSAKAHDSYIAARHALLQTFMGELTLAQNAQADPRMLLLKASQASRDTSTELHKTGLTSDRSMFTATWKSIFGSAQDKAAERLRHRVSLTDRDARTAASTSYYLLGIIHERGGKHKEALDAYQSAMKLAADKQEAEELGQPLAKYADDAGFRRALRAHVKLKEGM